MLNLGPGVTVPPAGSASATAVRRLQKDYAKLMQDPVDGIRALPNEDNILEWHYCLRGSPDTPFHGGFYWGKVIFKENFPWSPPALTMITPNGRFATNTRLCLSISDYHPESWNPGWTVSAILIGLHSFMNENQPAAGSIAGTPQEQKNLAAASKEFNVKYREFRRFFPQLVQEWTGVLPTPDEPDVAPTMLPEHATPNGIPVPTIQQHSSRAAYNNRQQIDEMMQAVLRPGNQPRMQQLIPGVQYNMFGLPRAGVVPAGPPQPPVANPVLYRDLAAIAAMQQQQMQQAQQQPGIVQQVMPQERNRAGRRGDEGMPIDALAAAEPVAQPEPPKERILRPRAPPKRDGRRAEVRARLGIKEDPQPEEEPLGRGVRRSTRRNEPPRQNAANEEVVIPPKRTRGPRGL
ncbi:hypothetical protein GCK72_006771 [Caenorhabditis remanei]|uniref:Ubiquitin-conjugating enzyme E2 J2 n=1 Tax=Caenorhabditis remanei TaxID=31234 RepID=A0A6A5HK94_CAERE|nr:hypothetical protein GCK72_006771 [Caenorhabditis remanei]KAF1766813.1 hypothetical protein GCK72_006771 [Caenorhabditis remanei]